MAFDPTGEEFQATGARAQALTTYRQFLADRDGKIATLRSTSGPGSDGWKHAQVDRSKAEAQKDGIGAKLGRPIEGNQRSGAFYLVPAVLIAMLEAFMNKFLLDNAFQLPNILTYFVSVVITLFMLSLAHMAGHMLRQCKGEYSERIFPWYIVLPIFLLVLIFGFISILTIGRAALETTATIEINIFSEVKRQVLHIGFVPSLLAALSDNNALMVAAMNTISVAVAFVAAFTRFDSDKDYQASYDEHKKSVIKTEDMGRRYAKDLEKISRKFSPKLSAAVANYGTHNSRVVAIKTNRGAALLDDDRYDLTKEDVMLAQARAELDVHGKPLTNKAVADSRSEESAPISVLARRV